jgi:predicted AAA+ superfamily ATPase
MKKRPIKRLLKAPDRSFFLFGPRGVGKTTWLKNVLAEAVYFDLLERVNRGWKPLPQSNLLKFACIYLLILR